MSNIGVHRAGLGMCSQDHIIVMQHGVLLIVGCTGEAR